MPRSSSTVSGFTLAIRAPKILSTLSIGLGSLNRPGSDRSSSYPLEVSKIGW